MSICKGQTGKESRTSPQPRPQPIRLGTNFPVRCQASGTEWCEISKCPAFLVISTTQRYIRHITTFSGPLNLFPPCPRTSSPLAPSAPTTLGDARQWPLPAPRASSGARCTSGKAAARSCKAPGRPPERSWIGVQPVPSMELFRPAMKRLYTVVSLVEHGSKPVSAWLECEGSPSLRDIMNMGIHLKLTAFWRGGHIWKRAAEAT